MNSAHAELILAAVAGDTSCAAVTAAVTQATFQSQSFDVVILDEASQMTEPLSLVPLLQARPR
jgi:superfamily I DNA and/or RNA helicase